MTTKERLHRLVDELSDADADATLQFIAARRGDPVVAAFENAPVDDEPFTAEDEDAVAAVRADRAAGERRLSLEEILRDHNAS